MSKEDQSSLRLAVIGTPRSGNTWARTMLAGLYGLEEIGVQTAPEIDWERLPQRCVIQIHWSPWPRFLKRLHRHGVQVVVMARHPLDVLMSWLNYAYYVHQEGYCHGAGHCKECEIAGALPRSEVFLNYIRSDAGRLLLSYSPAWWLRSGVLQLRYEDLLDDPVTTLNRLTHQIGEEPILPIAKVVESNSIRERKPSKDSWQYHFWQGRPGLWRTMLTPPEARLIAAANPYVFAFLGYECDPDETLDPNQADRNWLQLQLDSTREHLILERKKRQKSAADLTVTQTLLERTLGAHHEEYEKFQITWNDRERVLGDLHDRQRELSESDQRLASLHSHLEAVYAQLDDANSRLAPLSEIGPTLLRVALYLSRIFDPLRRFRSQVISPIELPSSAFSRLTSSHRWHPPRPSLPARRRTPLVGKSIRDRRVSNARLTHEPIQGGGIDRPSPPQE